MQRYLLFLTCILVSCASLAAGTVAQLQAFTQQKNYAQVLTVGAQMLEQSPQDVNVQFLFAYANQMTARTDKAIELYQELIRKHPELPEPRNNLAMIYLGQGDYDRASQLLVDAINTHSSYATAYANLSRVYKGIASEAYRRAVSESSEPASYTHDIQLTAITALDTEATPLPALALQASPDSEAAAATTDNQPTLVNAANLDTRLIETVRNWAQAWSGKQFDTYTDSYISGYRAGFASHDKWVRHRRSRIIRPGDIKVVVSDFSVKQRGAERASVDFIQAFSSPGYSDRVVKRLDFSRVGSQWKITSERVLSVL